MGLQKALQEVEIREQQDKSAKERLQRCVTVSSAEDDTSVILNRFFMAPTMVYCSII